MDALLESSELKERSDGAVVYTVNFVSPTQHQQVVKIFHDGLNKKGLDHLTQTLVEAVHEMRPNEAVATTTPEG